MRMMRLICKFTEKANENDNHFHSSIILFCFLKFLLFISFRFRHFILTFFLPPIILTIITISPKLPKDVRLSNNNNNNNNCNLSPRFFCFCQLLSTYINLSLLFGEFFNFALVMFCLCACIFLLAFVIYLFSFGCFSLFVFRSLSFCLSISFAMILL